MPDRDPRSRRAYTWLATVAGAVGGAALLRGLLPAAPERAPAASGRGNPVAPPSAASAAAGFETKDADAGSLTKVIFGAGVVVLGMIFGMIALQRYFQTQQTASEPTYTSQQTTPIVPPKPNLQADPLREIAALRAREDALLANYAWADAEHAHARIPIERAMALTVGKTLDAIP